METSLPICNTNPWTGFCMVGDFSVVYSQTDCNFNFNINVNVTVDSSMNSSFNFNFSQLLKDLPMFRIMKLERTSKITSQVKTILQCLYFSSLFLSIYLRNKRDMMLTYFLIAFVCTDSLTGLFSPLCTFIKLKACSKVQFFLHQISFIFVIN